MPDLDVDANVRLPRADRHPTAHQARSSYPQANAGFGQHVTFNQADLNIDDFTGKDHVLRSRGSQLEFQAPRGYGQGGSPSGRTMDMRDPRQTDRMRSDPRIRVPDNSGEYYVTAFSQQQNQRTPNQKYNTLGGPEFRPRNMDLEVPERSYQKGGPTSFLSNLM
ncbi:hypothetical protein EYF80_061029 [Liparis tanakae]|uniref:Uncharacterized protein n=1 Tax=Liparis tanakae TaxID=230148 RepID=A0A4Z2EJ21_9TELE|nr:hypothetical protein EYF80_061029 [Liparis tanakae]